MGSDLPFFSYQVLDDQNPVGVGGTSLDNALFVKLAVWSRSVADGVVDEVFGKELVNYSKIAFVLYGFVEPTKHGLVLSLVHHRITW